MPNRFHRHGDGNQPEDLPPDLESLRHRLIADSKVWQRETSAERLASFVRSLPQRTMTQQATLFTETSNHHTIDAQRTKGTPSMGHSRARATIPGAVVVTVVALLAIIITQFNPGHSHGQPGGHATPQPPTSTQHGTGWVPLPKLSVTVDNGSNGSPVIATTDPQVVYETLVNSGRPAILRRTDNGGDTWYNLSVPLSQDHVSYEAIYASPLNAHMVFLFIWDNVTQDCPADFLSTWYGGEQSNAPHCNLTYASTDGGVHWTLLHLPQNETFTPIPTELGVTSGPIFAQSSRLIAVLSGDCHPGECFHLASSNDGINWHFVDGDLLASGQSICDFSGTIAGDAVFAVTAHSHCVQDDQVPHTLWKSTDGGTHWSRVATLPTPNDFGIMAVTTTKLYGYLPRTTHVGPTQNGIPDVTFSSSPTDVQVSTDGGITWQAAPMDGAPTGQMIGQIVGTLADGSVVAEFITDPAHPEADGATLFAWKQGESAWRQIETPLPGSLAALLVTPSTTSAQGEIWLTLNKNGYSGDYTIVRSQG